MASAVPTTSTDWPSGCPSVPLEPSALRLRSVRISVPALSRTTATVTLDAAPAALRASARISLASNFCTPLGVASTALGDSLAVPDVVEVLQPATPPRMNKAAAATATGVRDRMGIPFVGPASLVP